MLNLNDHELSIVSGGININYRNLFTGALSSATIKTGAYYLEIFLPKGKKDDFIGEIWNGLVKGISSFGSTIAIGIAGAYVVAAINDFPDGEDHMQ